MKPRRTRVYYYHGDGDYCKADITSERLGCRCTRSYNVTHGSAWRLTRVIGRILSSKSYRIALVSPHGITVFF